jgi:hypothetical protein
MIFFRALSLVIVLVQNTRIQGACEVQVRRHVKVT